jgi:hypothetical protein
MENEKIDYEMVCLLLLHATIKMQELNNAEKGKEKEEEKKENG